jgi:plasmid stabilization system protein ParE
MTVRVVFTKEFRADLQAQTRWLLAEDKPDWAKRLIEEVEAAAMLLGASPAAGPIEVRRKNREVRRLVLRRLPFVVWYHWRTATKKVVVLRLFHVRQRRDRRGWK